MASDIVSALIKATNALLVNSLKEYPDVTFKQIARKVNEDLPFNLATSDLITPSRATSMIKGLESDGLLVVPVSDEYFTEYRGKPPTIEIKEEDDDKERRVASDKYLMRCLPTGRASGGIRGRKMAGVRLITLSDDVGQRLWELWTGKSMKSGASTLRRRWENAKDAIDQGSVRSGIAEKVREPAREIAREFIALPEVYGELNESETAA